MKKKIVLYVALAVLTLGIIGGATAVFASQSFAPDTEENDPIIDPSSVTVTQEQAIQTVLAQYPNAVIGQIELEDENGSVVYGIHITVAGITFDVKVDASNNVILHADSDNGDQSEEDSLDAGETDFED